MRPPGRSRTTWMKTIQQDLKSNPRMKQSTWLRIAHSRNWCLCMALCTPSGDYQKWMNEWSSVAQRLDSCGPSKTKLCKKRISSSSHAVPGGDVSMNDVMSVKILDGLCNLYRHVDQLLCVQRLNIINANSHYSFIISTAAICQTLRISIFQRLNNTHCDTLFQSF